MNIFCLLKILIRKPKFISLIIPKEQYIDIADFLQNANAQISDQLLGVCKYNY